jgi:copper chaperone CopZ
MKLKYLSGLLIFALLLAYVPSQTGAVEIVKNKTVKIKCTEMSCAGCKKKITQSINNLEGIKKLNINLETKIITVTFDETKTDSDKILGAIAEAGYESELIE